LAHGCRSVSPRFLGLGQSLMAGRVWYSRAAHLMAARSRERGRGERGERRERKPVLVGFLLFHFGSIRSPAYWMVLPTFRFSTFS
jgi:hypothetical protein